MAADTVTTPVAMNDASEFSTMSTIAHSLAAATLVDGVETETETATAPALLPPVVTIPFNPMQCITRSLEDSEPLEQQDIPADWVVLEVPSLYLRLDEAGPDSMLMHRRAVPVDAFIETALLMKAATEADATSQLDLSKRLVDGLVGSLTGGVDKADLDAVQEIIDVTLRTAQSINSSTPYTDTANVTLDFDRIVVSEVDAFWGLPQFSAPPPNTCPALYSLIESADERARVRQLVNDTDLNRAYRTLDYVNRMITFESGYLCSSLHAFINLALGYITLVNQSRPIRMFCQNDLRVRLLMLIVDAVIRSRVLAAWQRTPSARCLLDDIIETHDPRHQIIWLLGEPSAKARATRFLELLAKSRYASYVDQLTYDGYAEQLGKTRTVERSITYVSPSYQELVYLITLLPPSVFPQSKRTSLEEIVRRMRVGAAELGVYADPDDLAATDDDGGGARKRFRTER